MRTNKKSNEMSLSLILHIFSDRWNTTNNVHEIYHITALKGISGNTVPFREASRSTI